MDRDQALLEICPAQAAWNIVSGKWKPCIIHVLATGTMRFNRLKRTVPGITQRMLTRQLRELEADGLVARHHYPEIPARVEYELTALGQSILPIFTDLTDWWGQHEAAITRARQRYREAQPDRASGA